MATKCKHLGCSCTEFVVPTSKWTKNKSICKACNHSKKLHAAELVVTESYHPKEEVITINPSDTVGIIEIEGVTSKKVIPSASPDKFFYTPEIEQIDDISKFIVYGYCRMNNQSLYQISDVILYIILSYYYIFETEEFDINCCGPNITISKNKKIIDKKKKGGAGQIEGCFGINIIPSTMYKTYVWKFRNIGGEMEDSAIGICDSKIKKLYRGFTHDKKAPYYKYEGFNGMVNSWDQGYRWKNPICRKVGDIIMMKLEITEADAVLSYKINNNPEFVAFRNITQREDLSYKLAVSLAYTTSCIELMDFILEYNPDEIKNKGKEKKYGENEPEQTIGNDNNHVYDEHLDPSAPPEDDIEENESRNMHRPKKDESKTNDTCKVLIENEIVPAPNNKHLLRTDDGEGSNLYSEVPQAMDESELIGQTKMGNDCGEGNQAAASGGCCIVL